MRRTSRVARMDDVAAEMRIYSNPNRRFPREYLEPISSGRSTRSSTFLVFKFKTVWKTAQPSKKKVKEQEELEF